MISFEILKSIDSETLAFMIKEDMRGMWARIEQRIKDNESLKLMTTRNRQKVMQLKITKVGVG